MPSTSQLLSNSERQHITSSHKGAQQSNKAPLNSDYYCNSTYSSLKVYGLPRLFPNSSLHRTVLSKPRALPRPKWIMLCYGAGSKNTVHGKVCCLYIGDTEVSKTMVKAPGGFLKWEHTTTTTNIQIQVIRWGLGKANSSTLPARVLK